MPVEQPKAAEKIFDWYKTLIEVARDVENRSFSRFHENARLHALIVGGVLLITSYVLSNHLLPILFLAIALVCLLGAYQTRLWWEQIKSAAYNEALWYSFASDVEDTPEFQAATGKLILDSNGKPKVDSTGKQREVKVFSDPEMIPRFIPEERHKGRTPKMLIGFAQSVCVVYVALCLVNGYLFWQAIQKITSREGEVKNSGITKGDTEHNKLSNPSQEKPQEQK